MPTDPSEPKGPDAPSLDQVIEARLSRRDLLKGAAAGAALGVFGNVLGGEILLAQQPASNPSSLTFWEIPHGIEASHSLAPGYSARVLIRWGDKVLPGAPDFDVTKQTADAQAKQFGYNCDFVGFLPLPAGSPGTDRGLLCVNHEYTNTELMFPGITPANKAEVITQEQVDVEMAAHGHSVVEIRRDDRGTWTVVPDSRSNRRITATTEMKISGPAAGHERLKTGADPTGTRVLGMLNNCAGGTTPWGTVLTCEENFHEYFGGDLTQAPDDRIREYDRYGIKSRGRNPWNKFYDRFNLAKEPNEPNRFGWVVEFDPYDPASVPVKRTALGRLKHEGATTVLNRDGRLVLYTGDDEKGEYVYKFVTKGTYDPKNREANLGLLDEGTLYAARFDADGKVHWLPLVQGKGTLTADKGFRSQADVVIEARRAAREVGATRMDRPEDIETNPVSGYVYCVLTNNDLRGIGTVDAANPRPNNTTGHILEIIPPGAENGAGEADHAATEMTWGFFLMAGNPKLGGTYYGSGVSENGWLVCPDNICFDSQGRLWIATDQGGAQKDFGIGDGLYGSDVQGSGKALTRLFFRVPVGAETCGPCLTPDDKAFFVAVQHPGEGSAYESPSTRWPDFDPKVPPRPSVVAITKDDGGAIGG